MKAGFDEGMTGKDDFDSHAMEEEEEAEHVAPGCVRTHKRFAGPPKIGRIAGGKKIEAEDRPKKIFGIARGKVIEAEDRPAKLFSILGGKADYQLHAHAFLRKAASYNASRPIHKMAVTQNYGKKNMKIPASAQAKKAMKKRPASAEAMKADVRSCVHAVKVRSPVRTHCTALVGAKWQHVVTVSEHAHAKHADIVKHIGAQVQSGKLSFDDRG